MLIVGLGNPGARYTRSRHNAGFIAIEEIAKYYGINGWKQNKNLKSEIAISQSNGQKLIFVKPISYMNLSGTSVLAVISYYKLSINNTIVIYDDIDLDLAKVKCKFAGGSGGHNGIKSIDQLLGLNYYRLRIGIGRPSELKQDVSDYVLGDFNKDELQQIAHSTSKIVDNFHLLLEHKLEKFQHYCRATTTF
ncbi:MAG: aminoacyl-tRNA hydrolase [Rickettsiaceae bacterium]